MGNAAHGIGADIRVSSAEPLPLQYRSMKAAHVLAFTKSRVLYSGDFLRFESIRTGHSS
jgi:hypothetical protein